MTVKNTVRKQKLAPRIVIYHDSFRSDYPGLSLKQLLKEQAGSEGLSTSALCVRYLLEGLTRSQNNA